MTTWRGVCGSALGCIDKYLLQRELGEGGFGAVYLAIDAVASGMFDGAAADTPLRDPVYCAVKGLPQEIRSNDDELGVIRDNFALVRKLHHPHIAAALDLHLAEKVRYSDDDTQRKLRIASGDTLLVMEYAPGVTLNKWRKMFDGKRVPVAKAVEIARKIAQALDYAHGERIIHRDIKPSNIMVDVRKDGTSNVKVLDFGLAAEIRTSMGRVSLEVREKSGTRPYMAPEQWQGRRQGPATDQYALAVLLYELLTGEVPFASVFETDDPAIMQMVVTSNVPDMPKWLPKPVRRALTKALAKAPEDRFASCSDFIAAVEGKSKGGEWKVALLVIAVVTLLANGWWLASRRNDNAKPTPSHVIAAPPAPKPAPVIPVQEPKPAPVIPVQETKPEPKPAPVIPVQEPKQEPKPAPVIPVQEPKPEPKPAPAIPVQETKPEPKPAPMVPGLEPKPEQKPMTAVVVPAQNATADAMPTPKIETVAVKKLALLDTRMFKGGELRRVEISPDVVVDMVWCPPGEFMMGSPTSERDRGRDEPQHNVKIERGFWIGRYEVSQMLWKYVMGGNPSKSMHFQNAAEYPVDSVSRDSCQSFISSLNVKAGSDGFRLPTEAEWEYACRAGTKTAYCFGNHATSTDMQVRGSRQSGGPVKCGTYRANAWGIFDMHGNLAEWCYDLYAEYGSEPGWRNRGYVLRGGSWHDRLHCARSAARSNQKGSKVSPMFGMRLCFSSNRNVQEKKDWGLAENTRMALDAFAAGNWSLGFSLAERADQSNPGIQQWLGKCYDPLVRTPGFRIDKDFFKAREHYGRAEELSNLKKGNNSK